MTQESMTQREQAFHEQLNPLRADLNRTREREELRICAQTSAAGAKVIEDVAQSMFMETVALRAVKGLFEATNRAWSEAMSARTPVRLVAHSERVANIADHAEFEPMKRRMGAR